MNKQPIYPQSSVNWQTIAQQCIYDFPDPILTDLDGKGFIATGADLSVATLISAYAQGLFPWFNENDPIVWWSPDPRCVLKPAEFTASKSLRKQAKRSDWSMTINTAFRQIIAACSEPRHDGDTDHASWITQDIQEAYLKLHQLGFAHSIEIWNTQQQLIGGLYGLKLGAIFCGESMFHRQSNASKIAFWWLNRLCCATGITLIDCQLPNDHLLSLGANVISRKQFLTDLPKQTSQPSKDWSIIHGQKIAVKDVLLDKPFMNLPNRSKS